MRYYPAPEPGEVLPVPEIVRVERQGACACPYHSPPCLGLPTKDYRVGWRIYRICRRCEAEIAEAPWGIARSCS